MRKTTRKQKCEPAQTQTPTARDVFITFRGENLQWLEDRRQSRGYERLQDVLHDLVRSARVAEIAPAQ